MDHSVLYKFSKLFEKPRYHELFSYREELKLFIHFSMVSGIIVRLFM